MFSKLDFPAAVKATLYRNIFFPVHSWWCTMLKRRLSFRAMLCIVLRTILSWRHSRPKSPRPFWSHRRWRRFTESLGMRLWLPVTTRRVFLPRAWNSFLVHFRVTNVRIINGMQACLLRQLCWPWLAPKTNKTRSYKQQILVTEIFLNTFNILDVMLRHPKIPINFSSI